ncbi:SDR family oxidoreductase [Parerythrobacter jejuensis]|uniref:NAD(P)H-binding protein n=1 Tax=Parerythrobacter jejuensis TaxID=795812 RepID=A0A845AHU4_9SPHN|nr:NmrA family NAD(P)-binding protein [Parerythrobacter jejuensis]MXP30212.1 NAD(P)H-binding protein [Parerythrobacter jejuensis]MXP32972.1 NAD(P)H-binding protein [Parerythrobacter jejuensis]
MTIEKICVLGAPADQGQPLVQSLRKAGFHVTAGVRRRNALADTPFPDLPTIHADITDPDAMATAFTGQDAAAFHLPFEFDREKAAGFGRVIAEGAQRAGLKKIVFNTACFVADHDLDLSAHDGRRDIEAALEATGIPCVFIEPTVFMDNQYRIWTRPLIMREGVFAYPAKPDLKINWVCLDDVAQAMTRALQTDAADGQHVPLGGPQALVGDEVAANLSEAIGKPVRFQSLAPEEFAARMSELVTGSREVQPLSIYDGMAKFYAWYNAQPTSPLLADPAHARDLLGMEPTTHLDWAKSMDWSAGLPG